ncbi:MAG: ribosome-associated translation inhibitor RaiA [Anaerolineales bacterium]
MAAKVEIFGREMKIDAALNDYVEKKASKLDRYVEGVEGVRVDLAYRKAKRSADDRYKVQITLHGKGFVLRAEERTDQVHSAFDAAVDKIQRQMERYKGKRYQSQAKNEDQSLNELAELESVYVEEPPAEIARRKRFVLYPMTAVEAVEQMKLVGHEQFFIFYNMDAGCVSVLYKRSDGDYGLIDTELA